MSRLTLALLTLALIAGGCAEDKKSGSVPDTAIPGRLKVKPQELKTMSEQERADAKEALRAFAAVDSVGAEVLGEKQVAADTKPEVRAVIADLQAACQVEPRKRQTDFQPPYEVGNQAVRIDDRATRGQKCPARLSQTSHLRLTLAKIDRRTGAVAMEIRGRITADGAYAREDHRAALGLSESHLAFNLRGRFERGGDGRENRYVNVRGAGFVQPAAGGLPLKLEFQGEVLARAGVALSQVFYLRFGPGVPAYVLAMEIEGEGPSRVRHFYLGDRELTAAELKELGDLGFGLDDAVKP